jgi:hypothetical protein
VGEAPRVEARHGLPLAHDGIEQLGCREASRRGAIQGVDELGPSASDDEHAVAGDASGRVLDAGRAHGRRRLPLPRREAVDLGAVQDDPGILIGVRVVLGHVWPLVPAACHEHERLCAIVTRQRRRWLDAWRAHLTGLRERAARMIIDLRLSGVLVPWSRHELRAAAQEHLAAWQAHGGVPHPREQGCSHRHPLPCHGAVLLRFAFLDVVPDHEGAPVVEGSDGGAREQHPGGLGVDPPREAVRAGRRGEEREAERDSQDELVHGCSAGTGTTTHVVFQAWDRAR